jgi:hypothetical protein
MEKYPLTDTRVRFRDCLFDQTIVPRMKNSGINIILFDSKNGHDGPTFFIFFVSKRMEWPTPIKQSHATIPSMFTYTPRKNLELIAEEQKLK